jgi:hypothetical protein
MAIPKGVKYALLALAPVALAVSLWFNWGDQGGAPSSYMLVDVFTGNVTQMKSKDLISVPAPNDKGEFALLRCVKDESGHYVVAERDREALISGYFAGKPNLKIDLTNFRVIQ